MSSFQGKAVGGPLDGIKITASFSWNGRMVKAHYTKSIIYHPGRYVLDLDKATWVWEPEEEKQLNNKSPQDFYA